MYSDPVSKDDHIMTVEEFREAVRTGGFVDYDGFGCAVKDGLEDPKNFIYPSQVENIPEDATHIVWFNR